MQKSRADYALGEQREPRQKPQDSEQASHTRASYPAVSFGTGRQKDGVLGVSSNRPRSPEGAVQVRASAPAACS